MTHHCQLLCSVWRDLRSLSLLNITDVSLTKLEDHLGRLKTKRYMYISVYNLKLAMKIVMNLLEETFLSFHKASLNCQVAPEASNM